jgi:cell division protein FtsQ
MSIFLERQKVRKRRALAKWFRLAERVLLSVATVVGGLAILYGFYLLVFVGGTFSIHEVVVDGQLDHLSMENVVDLSGVKLGQNLFGADVGIIYKQLRGHPWIERATVRRRLPHTLWIYVEEYSPAAIIDQGDGLMLVDHEGNIFKSLDSMDPKELPIITGIQGNGDEQSKSQLVKALTLITSYYNSFFGQTWGVAELHWDEMNGYSIMTERGPVEIVLGHDAASRFDLLDRWQGILGRHGGIISYILANEEKRLTVGYN